MSKKGNVSENAKKAIMEAELELQNYPEMPEHYSTMLKHPSMDATGYYSELDFEIAARLRRCETSIQTKGMLEKAMYDHVRGEIETKGAELKKEIIKLSKQHRIITRAVRMCDVPETKEELTKMADALKSSKAVKDYNHLITALEYYSGIHAGKKSMPSEAIEALDRCIDYQTDGHIAKPSMDTSELLKTLPSKIKIDLGNMDKFAEQMMQSHPSFREKSEDEKEKSKPKEKLVNSTATAYAVDTCKDTLDALAENLEERMDLLIINGQTLREMMEEKTKKKDFSKEEIETLSCVYVNAALRTGGNVEVFAPYLTTDGNKIYRPDSVIIEGTEPREKVTMKFWEILLAMLGFFKDKYKDYNEQQKKEQEMKQKMDACRERVRNKLAYNPRTKEEIKEAEEKGLTARKVCSSLNKAQKKEQESRKNIIEKYKDEYINAVRMREKITGHRDAVLYSFYPEEAANRKGVLIHNKLDSNAQIFRDSPLYYAVARMLNEGYSLKEILDPTKLGDVRARIGREFKEDYEKMTKEEISKLHVDSMKTLAKEMPALVKEMSQVIKTKEDLRENYHKYYVGLMCMNVLHMDHIKNDVSVAYCGGEKEYDALVDQLREADAFYGLKNVYDGRYQNFYKALDGGFLNARDIAEINMKEEIIIAGLNGKEPHLAPKLQDNDLFLMGLTLQEHPEIKECQEKMDKLDEKMLGDLLKNGASKSLDIKVEIYDQPLKVTENFGVIGPGEMLGMNLVINGQKMLKMEEPLIEKTTEEPEIEEEKTL